MKTLAAALSAFAVTLLVSASAYALPGCSSGFCNGGGNQCTLNGQTHTCGSCMGGTTTVLYSGDLTSGAADERCRCQHDPAANCSRTINPTLKEKKAAPAKTIAP
jgi:hypothetical protein